MAAASRRLRRHRSGRTWGRLVAVALAIVVVAGGAVWAVVAVLERSVTIPVVASCTSAADGSTWRLSPEQADNAALIATMSVRRGLPARAATIALATALQESGLINLDHGDRDSVGLFQQRPSQGWGTVEQILDPVYAAGQFYDHLVRVPGYTELPVTEAAQAVQRSAFPDAYAQHEPRARAFASALTGWSPATLSCTLTPDAAAAGSSDAVLTRVARDLAVPSSATPADDEAGTPATVTLEAASLAADDPARGAWAAGQWSVAMADTLSLDTVAVADQVWTRAAGAWEAATAPLATGRVVLTLAG